MSWGPQRSIKEEYQNGNWKSQSQNEVGRRVTLKDWFEPQQNKFWFDNIQGRID